jgi:hypothetical protein
MTTQPHIITVQATAAKVILVVVIVAITIQNVMHKTIKRLVPAAVATTVTLQPDMMACTVAV